MEGVLIGVRVWRGSVLVHAGWLEGDRGVMARIAPRRTNVVELWFKDPVSYAAFALHVVGAAAYALSRVQI